MTSNLAYSTYSQNNISIESPEKLIEMLYEGILRFSSRARMSIIENNIEKKVYFINRTHAIFVELVNSLDYSHGNVAHYLSGLYLRQIQLLSQANIENKINYLDEVIKVTRELLEAWRETTGEKQMA